MNKTPQNEKFVSHLLNLLARARESGSARAALARLRRATAGDPRYDPRVFEAVGAALPAEARGWDLDAHLLTACLFALYVQGRDALPEGRLPGRRGSLGASACFLRRKMERDGKAGAESLDRRFTALLETPAEDLDVRLRRLLHLLRSHDVPIRFDLLLSDLRQWKWGRRYVARRWAEDYWQPVESAT